jgi:hypothetical protein
MTRKQTAFNLGIIADMNVNVRSMNLRTTADTEV